MGDKKLAAVDGIVKREQASPRSTRMRSVLAFLGWGLALGLVGLVSSLPGIPGSWVQALQWTGTAWLLGLYVLAPASVEDERRYPGSGFWIRSGSGMCAALGIALIFGAPWTVIALAVPAGAMLGASGKYWVKYL